MTDQSIIERAMSAVADTRQQSNWIVRSGRKEIVRAVLQAIREPTEAMKQAGGGAIYDHRDDLAYHTAEPTWQAMIDAALAEPPDEA